MTFLRTYIRPATVALIAAVALAVPAIASHGTATLLGSNFEIDDNANLKVDHTAAIDWLLEGTNTFRPDVASNGDEPSGQTDDSYTGQGGGAKEDDTCPNTETGSIPNNKSDLLTFGAHVEAEVGGPGFLNLFWTRVQEPSGTTLMDFELNQSSILCANGVNPVRTEGDLLIEYRIEQGGARAVILVREWTGTAWGPAEDLTAQVPQLAAGTINQTSIPAGESGGLGTISPRTFGEAQLDLDFVFDEGKCESFGSAFLKSRSSTSFTSALKDFIEPVPVNITNCGKVIVRKQTDPDEDPNTTQFGYTKSFGTDPATPSTFTLTDDDDETFTNVLFGSGYTVVEDVVPAGWDFVDVDCSASTGVTPSTIVGATVTFDIDNASDVLDCTYTNRARGAIVVEKITDDGQGAFEFTSDTLPSPFTLTTTGAGAAGKDSSTFADLPPGTYDVAETVPAGWNLVSATCDDDSDPASIGLSGGETVTCTFHDARERGAILITKTRKHAAGGPGDHPHPEVTFTVTGGELPASGVTAVTNSTGIACVDGLVLSSHVGAYTVTETVPNGYVADGLTAQSVSVTTEATCPGGDPVSFSNTPLTNLTVSVDSQVDGGTASTIDCGAGVVNTGPNGDGSTSRNNLQPGTYTCTIVIDP